MKKYILPRLLQIPRIYYIIMSFFFTSYHRFMKKYILPRLFQIPRIYYIITSFFFTSSNLLYYYIVLFHFVSLGKASKSLQNFPSYHRIMRKYILPSVFKYLAFTILVRHYFSLCIIVSWKNIFYPGFPNTVHLLLLRHSFSLRIIVSWKNISYPGFSKYLEFTILLRRSFSLRIIIVSWKNILPRLFQLPCSTFTILLRHSFSLHIIVSWKNISYPGFSTTVQHLYYIITSFFLTL